MVRIAVTRRSHSEDSQRSNLWAEPALPWSFMEWVCIVDGLIWALVRHLPLNLSLHPTSVKIFVCLRWTHRSRLKGFYFVPNNLATLREPVHNIMFLEKKTPSKADYWKTVRNMSFSDFDSPNHKINSGSLRYAQNLTASLSCLVKPLLTFLICTISIHNIANIRFHWSSIKVDLPKMMIKGMIYPARWASLWLVIWILWKCDLLRGCLRQVIFKIRGDSHLDVLMSMNRVLSPWWIEPCIGDDITVKQLLGPDSFH